MKLTNLWITKLNLRPHPEGGFYKETYKSNEILSKAVLPGRFSGDRAFSTSIYFFLEKNDFSAFHRIKQDELWHFYDGTSLVIHIIDVDSIYFVRKLGLNIEKGEQPQVIVKAGCFFAVEILDKESYCLTGCTVAPGFDFDDFEMPSRNDLIELFPLHEKVITQLTRLTD